MASRSDSRRPSVWRCVGAGDHAALQALLDAGAPPDDPGEDEVGTPLWLAAKRGDATAVAQLLGAGADVEGRARWFTPRLAAAMHGHADVEALLVQHGAGDHHFAAAARGDRTALTGSPPARDEYGRTRLHYAAAGLHADLVEALLREGEATDVVDGGGATPLDLACDARRVDPRGRVETLAALCAAGAEPNRKDPKGATPLHRAARARSAAAVRELLRRRVDPDPVDERGVTPLRLAVRAAGGRNRADALEVVRLLLAAGASPERREHQGRTARDEARGPELREMLAASGVEPKSRA